jgi:hypothetical protein
MEGPSLKVDNIPATGGNYQWKAMSRLFILGSFAGIILRYWIV